MYTTPCFNNLFGASLLSEPQIVPEYLDLSNLEDPASNKIEERQTIVDSKNKEIFTATVMPDESASITI
ncbi:MAG: hypothetical protein QRY74_05925 [Chlamydia sp.]